MAQYVVSYYFPYILKQHNTCSFYRIIRLWRSVHFLLLWKMYRIPYGHIASLNSIRNRKVRSNNLIEHRSCVLCYVYLYKICSIVRTCSAFTSVENKIANSLPEIWRKNPTFTMIFVINSLWTSHRHLHDSSVSWFSHQQLYDSSIS